MKWETGTPRHSGEWAAGGAITPRAAEIHRRAADNVSRERIAQAGTLENIEVISIRPVGGSGAVKARVVVRIGEITLHEAKVIQEPGKRPWFAPPDRAWVGDDGKTRYVRLVELAKPLNDRVTAAVLAACERADG